MDEALIKKVQPNSLKAEQSVIGSMIMEAEAITKASEILKKEDWLWLVGLFIQDL